MAEAADDEKAQRHQPRAALPTRQAAGNDQEPEAGEGGDGGRSGSDGERNHPGEDLRSLV
jgi:hypothetical protein